MNESQAAKEAMDKVRPATEKLISSITEPHPPAPERVSDEELVERYGLRCAKVKFCEATIYEDILLDFVKELRARPAFDLDEVIKKLGRLKLGYTGRKFCGAVSIKDSAYDWQSDFRDILTKVLEGK